MLFTRKSDLDLAIIQTVPKYFPLGTYPTRQYLGTVEVPNKTLVGGKRICDLYVDVSEYLRDHSSTWFPIVYADTLRTYRSHRLGRAFVDEWDWRQAIGHAEKVVLNQWWSILNKRPIQP